MTTSRDRCEAMWIMRSGNQVGKTADQLRKILLSWNASGKDSLRIEVISSDALAERERAKGLVDALKYALEYSDAVIAVTDFGMNKDGTWRNDFKDRLDSALAEYQREGT